MVDLFRLTNGEIENVSAASWDPEGKYKTSIRASSELAQSLRTARPFRTRLGVLGAHCQRQSPVPAPFLGVLQGSTL